MMSRRGQGLPVNVVVMMIIGIILFSLGFALFMGISRDAQTSINELNDGIRTDISRMECSGNDWICSPSNRLRNGRSSVFQVYIVNRGGTNSEFFIDFPNLVEVAGGRGISNNCGEVILTYPNIGISVLSGNSASVPFSVSAHRVGTTPCSFTSVVVLRDDFGEEVGRTPVIIRVE